MTGSHLQLCACRRAQVHSRMTHPPQYLRSRPTKTLELDLLRIRPSFFNAISLQCAPYYTSWDCHFVVAEIERALCNCSRSRLCAILYLLGISTFLVSCIFTVAENSSLDCALCCTAWGCLLHCWLQFQCSRSLISRWIHLPPPRPTLICRMPWGN